MWGQANEYFPLAALVMLLLFARSGLYRDRAQRPGFARVIASLFQVTLVVLIYAEIEGEPFQSYYIFYGVAVLRAAVRVAAALGLRAACRARVLRAAGYRRRAVLVGSGPNIQAVSHALRDSKRDRALRLRGAHPGRAARRAARLPLARAARAQLRRHRRGADHRPRLPPGRGGRAGRPLPPARRARAGGALDDGDPDGPGGVRARPGAAAVRAEAAGVRGRGLRDQAQLRPGRRDAAASSSLSPLMALAALAIKLTSRGPVLYRSMRPGIGGRIVPLPQVPHDGARAPTTCRSGSRSTTRSAARSSRSATTRA